MAFFDSVQGATATKTQAGTNTTSTTNQTTQNSGVTNPFASQTNSSFSLDTFNAGAGSSISDALSKLKKKEDKDKYIETYIQNQYTQLKGKSKSEQQKSILADLKKVLADVKDPDSFDIISKKIAELEKEVGTVVPDSKDTSKPAAKVKTGESIDERLTRYYSKYKDAKTKEEKEAFLKRYLEGSYAASGKSRAEQIKIQLADFKKLLSNTQDPDSYEMLAKQIYILESENQVSAAKSAVNEQEDKVLKEKGAIGVAQSVHLCATENQTELTSVVIGSGSQEAMVIGAGHASDCDTTQQQSVVSLYHDAYKDIQPKDEKEKAEIEKLQVELDKTLVDQYGKYAKENELAIHKTISTSAYEETIKYAASNIFKFDKENQLQASEITINTGCNTAITALALQAGKCDKSVQEALVTKIPDYETRLAESNLPKVETKEENKTVTEANDQETIRYAQPAIPAKESVSYNSYGNESTKLNVINETVQNVNDKTEDLQTLVQMVKDLSDVEKIALVKASTDPTVINAVMKSNPSLTVLSAMKAKDFESVSLKDIGYNFYFLNADAQITIMQRSSIYEINRDILKPEAKKIYDKIMAKTKRKDV